MLFVRILKLFFQRCLYVRGLLQVKGFKRRKIADFFDVSLDYLMTGEEKEGGETYYINEETKEIAQKVFENKSLRMLMDSAQDATPEDIETVHSMLLALKRKERGNID